jgi:glycosyltransferase involved in cell wall biosynthesis
MTDINPKITVCVVTYNQEKYIRQCLQSIVDQVTDCHFDVLVADDCSTDVTREIVSEFVEKYPGVVKAIFHKKNIGPYKNYAFVHDQALGEYVAHIDGDDLMFGNKLQSQCHVLDSNPELTAVWHRVDFFDDAGSYCSGKGADLSPFNNGVVLFDDAIRLGYVSVHSSLMYRKAARKQKLIHTDIIDLYTTWQLLSSGPGFVLSEVLGAYRVAAAGSILLGEKGRIRQLALEHAKCFSAKFPEKRKFFFLYALSYALIRAKNRRWDALLYFRFAIKMFVFIWPADILANLRDVRRIQVPWKR